MFLNLGNQPLPNGFLTKKQLGLPEYLFPLNVYFCDNCKLVQIIHNVPYDLMFRNYLYATPKAKSIQDHYSNLADTIVSKMDLDEDSFVIDIGSNVGVLLKNFQKHGIRTLGVDPAVNIAEMAIKNGVETIPDYFTENLALKIVKEKGKSDVITITQSLSQVDDLNDLVRGVKTLLKDDGIFIIEVPYLVDLINNLEFDTIHFEHNYYFSLKPLSVLLKNINLEIFDVERIPVHGGSIRIYIKKSSSKIPISKSVQELSYLEQKMGLYYLETYKKFASEVERLKRKIASLLEELKSVGHSIAGYGASAKGNVLLNYCNVGNETIDFIVDKNPLKQGLYTPGKKIPVVPHEVLLEKNPDYVLVLAWNFLDDIVKSCEDYIIQGGEFIVPLPEPKIIS